MTFRYANSGYIWLLCLASLSITGLTSAQSTQQRPVDEADSASYAGRSTLALQSMQKWYDLETGLYKTTGWWNAANLITTLGDYSKSQRSHVYDFVFSNTLSTAQKKFPGFINENYDDEGWWALAWIDVYEQTHDPRYLEAAKFIFKDMAYGWDDTCSGGIWWSKDRKYKNAIANELFLSVAAKLAIETRDIDQQKEYLTWAHKEWVWFSHSGMINQKNLVNDGLNGDCENNGRTTWTYNQGVILGGLTALSRVDHSSSALAMADKIAQAAISNLSDAQGVLHDTCEPHCGADGTQFKGIFIRNLRELNEAGPQGRPFNQFILTNARSIWSQVQPPDYHLGEVWGPPFGATDASTQGSALDALVAATTVTSGNNDR
jgi:predicted alpha-1,6-mannanase (GH76 family)